MSEKQRYQLLLEDNCTMEEVNDTERSYIKCRVERVKPEVDWNRRWRLARLPGLGSENVSFIFKMLHQILPTQERVARTKPGASPVCQVKGCKAVGGKVVQCLQEYQPDLEVEQALRLELLRETRHSISTNILEHLVKKYFYEFLAIEKQVQVHNELLKSQVWLCQLSL